MLQIFQKITELNLSGNENIACEELWKITVMKDVEIVRLRNCNFGSEDIKQFHLYLGQIKVSQIFKKKWLYLNKVWVAVRENCLGLLTLSKTPDNNDPFARFP